MPCTAHQAHPPTATPPAAKAPTAAAGSSPASNGASPAARTSATRAAGPTTSAHPNQTAAHALALAAVVQAGILSANLYSSLVDNPHPTRADVALWVGWAGDMHRQSEAAIARLVDLYTELIVTLDESPTEKETNMTSHSQFKRLGRATQRMIEDSTGPCEICDQRPGVTNSRVIFDDRENDDVGVWVCMECEQEAVEEEYRPDRTDRPGLPDAS